MQGSGLERLEGGVALDGLGERHAALRAEIVAVEAAHTGKRSVRRSVCSESACFWG